MPNDPTKKTVYEATDAQPVALYAKLSLTERDAIPVLTSTDGSLVVQLEDLVTATEGSQKQALVHDKESRSTLVDILKELKIINIHLSCMSGMDIKTQDVEV